MQKLIGIDIGGTKCAVCLGGESPRGAFKISAKKCFPSVRDGKEISFSTVVEELEKFLHESGAKASDFSAVGVSVGGCVDSKRGILVSTPVMPSWRTVKIGDALKRKLGIPAFVCNDANACALAEWKYGAGKGCRNMVFLTCGTGLGAGLILDGGLYEGAQGNAGEIGHIRLENIGPAGCGKAGSLEGFASGAGIAQLGRIRALEMLQSGSECSFCKTIEKLPDITAKSISEAAEAGNADAARIYAEAGDYLGRGIAVLADILNPERVVIGSIFARSEKLLRPSMERAIEREAMPVAAKSLKVLPAKLGEHIGDFAALAIAASNAKEIK